MIRSCKAPVPRKRDGSFLVFRPRRQTAQEGDSRSLLRCVRLPAVLPENRKSSPPHFHTAGLSGTYPLEKPRRRAFHFVCGVCRAGVRMLGGVCLPRGREKRADFRRKSGAALQLRFYPVMGRPFAGRAGRGKAPGACFLEKYRE